MWTVEISGSDWKESDWRTVRFYPPLHSSLNMIVQVDISGTTILCWG